jgi:hypothetical protein
MGDRSSAGTAGLPLQPGVRFGGTDGKRFEVEALVGEGGQALVFRVKDTRLGRVAAAKVSTAHERGQKRIFLERFERELQLSSRVNHPHVLQVYDCGELPEGAPYVLLEWMARGSLTSLIEKARGSGRAIPLGYVKYYAQALAAALRAVHAAHMIHRDIKPDNVLIGQDGVAKLTDFGIAKDISPDAIPLTEMGQTMGTLGFMAPEQLSGLPGPQSDIFSFGATVYAMVVGRPPAQKTLNSIPLGKILDEAWEPVPGPFKELLRATTAAPLEERLTDFDQVLERLRNINLADDPRHVLAPGQLPPLPSTVFSAFGPSGEGVPAASAAPDETAELPEAKGEVGETMDLTVVPSGPRPLVESKADTALRGSASGSPPAPAPAAAAAAAAPKRAPEPGPTRAQVAHGAAGSAAAVQPAPGRSAAAPPPQSLVERSGASADDPVWGAATGALPATGAGASSAPTLSTPPAAARSRTALIAAVVAGIVLLGGGAVALLGTPAMPDAAALAKAAAAFDEAASRGDWAAAAAAASSVPAAASAEPFATLLRAEDALLAGDLGGAGSLAGPLQAQGGELGARAALVAAASARIDAARPQGEAYAAAARAYSAAAACTDPACAPLQARARLALAESCAVLASPGPMPADCAGDLANARPPRDAAFLAASVLLQDGRRADAERALERALGTAAGAGAVPGCVEARSLGAWLASPPQSAALVAAVREAGLRAARDAESCRSFGQLQGASQ